MRASHHADQPDQALKFTPAVCILFGWDDDRSRVEIDLLREKIRARYKLTEPTFRILLCL